MSDKVFVGRGKEFETKYGKAFKIEMTVNELQSAIKAARERGWMKSFTRKDGTEEEQVTLTFWTKKEPNDYGTHYGVLEEPYRPKGNNDGREHRQRDQQKLCPRIDQRSLYCGG